ncbi:hypothetical protein SASPL_128926 [Salvia splendens]|uniref:RNA helicase n=1 Tax=Salvia splendens TaxID=180675 RepID=A0A8X8XER6_SALSN|nr:hypothetical protein SASPL_128926 [Salvia splendens]
MPSAIAEAQSADKKKIKKNSGVAEMEVEDKNSAEKKPKKEKKTSKKAKLTDLDDSNSDSPVKISKKEKKRKALEIDDNEEGRSENTSEMKKKMMKFVEDDEKEENPNAVSNFRISAPLREALKAKGIEALFQIQAMTFNTILDGSDLVGRARTGQVKIIYLNHGNAPSVLVLLPTRELAAQVAAEFEVYGRALGLSCCVLYGGSSYGPQLNQLKRGVDIVVGTPGRIKDHLESGNIDFRSLKFRVLDEADEMLRMGFVDDVELIRGKVEDSSKVQTLLFSATLPSWVKQTRKLLRKPDRFVGSEKMKTSTNVRHFVLPCTASARAQLIPDIISCYGSGGRTIIFAEAKDSVSTLSGVLPGARSLHGDIQQSTREVTLKAFRSGKFATLVATDVAARWLDIDDVQLIIQCEPPCDVEAYIHRSGRTGRAGKSGVAVMLYDPRKSNFARIERESGVKFERISAPQPSDIAKSAGVEAAEKINEISDSVIPIFKAAAEELLDSSDLTPTDLLAKALANAAGYTEIKSRSLLTSLENHVTVLLECGRPIFSPSYVYGALRRFVPEDKVESIQDLSLTADGKGAVFDVATEDLDTFLAGQGNAPGVSLQVVTLLPDLQEREPLRGRFGGGRGGFSGRRGGGRFLVVVEEDHFIEVVAIETVDGEKRTKRCKGASNFGVDTD